MRSIQIETAVEAELHHQDGSLGFVVPTEGLQVPDELQVARINRPVGGDLPQPLRDLHLRHEALDQPFDQCVELLIAEGPPLGFHHPEFGAFHLVRANLTLQHQRR